jgi:DNA-binding transcriptional MerR regulator
MLIGELSARTGVSRRSLRYYEQHELLHARRTPNGWRDYDEAAAHRVRTIAEMIDNGLTLEGVKQLGPCLDMHNESDCDNPDLALATYQARLAVVDQRLAKLHRHRDGLSQQIQSLHAGAAPGSRSAPSETA